MRWTTLVKNIIIIRRTFCFASEISNQLLSSMLVVVFQSSLLISSLIDLSSGLLFYLFLYELQKLSHTFCPPRVDRDQMSKQINILHILILNVDLTSFYEWERLQSDMYFEINPTHFARDFLVKFEHSWKQMCFLIDVFFIMFKEQVALLWSVEEDLKQSWEREREGKWS